MPDEDWIEKRIIEARAGLEVIDEATSNTIKQLLSGKLNEKELRPKELAETANLILGQLLGHGDKAAQ
jgi:hypothetical protein